MTDRKLSSPGKTWLLKTPLLGSVSFWPDMKPEKPLNWQRQLNVPRNKRRFSKEWRKRPSRNLSPKDKPLRISRNRKFLHSSGKSGLPNVFLHGTDLLRNAF